MKTRGTYPKEHPNICHCPPRTKGAPEEEHRMCFKVECSKCGKFTWNGCGKHVASVYDGIEKGKHCTCKPWPGVDTKADGSTSNPKEGVRDPLNNVISEIAVPNPTQGTAKSVTIVEWF
ncbi:Os12g0596101 [Oryza sativa Japonica Group]|uniref:Os12g0596101 protein n=1 Tax=Oryza sativa subsp. japonica TaxID=39947 RepID=C7J9N3_ORYSJ|nr:Os12g0596101 [Oryza sativa Japonica Group]|eukprot:NP_001177043.1 Os12g0596101 [Oryza sativa Japonica Group]